MKIEAVIEEQAHHFLQDVKTEYKGEKEASTIIQKYIKEGKISDEEEVILKTQLIDLLKIVGIGVPFALIPGASILIKIAAKYNIEWMPSAFINKQP